MSKAKEVRQTSGNIEVRAVGGEIKKTIGGYAVKYNSPTLIRDRWGDEFLEEISTGAFDKSLQKRNQKALWNHDSSKPLGSVAVNTLRFNSDSAGLNYDVDLPDNTYGNDAFVSVQRGDVDGSSFGFTCLENVWSKVQYEGREIYKRSITEAELIEVSPCTFPAYESSEINVRSIDENLKKKEKRAKNDMEEMDPSIPEGTKEVENPKYPVDSTVIPNVEHMEGHLGKEAKVLKVVTGTFYIVDFEDGNGPHKWYAEGELDPLDSEDDDEERNRQEKQEQKRRLLLRTYL